MAGQTAGPVEEVPVGEGGGVVGDGHGVGGAGGPGGDQLVQKGVQVVVAPLGRARGEHSPAFGVVGQRQPSDGPFGVDEGRAEQGEQPSGVGGGGTGGVPLGVGVGVQPHPGAAGVGEEVEAQVVHGSGGQVVRGARQAREGHLGVEGHHVDSGAGELLAAALGEQLAVQPLAAEALVAQGVAEFPGHLGGDLGEGGGARGGDPHREFVGEHGRGADGRAGGAGGQRHPQQGLLAAGEPALVDGDGRDEQGGGPYGEPPGGVPQQ